ncbi:hypothetical protein BCR43DRAFT_489130 [Syncephalastrum racemosum]|uniref:Uncharacterized protein n=1 Tax=Syncephalastrum racemosum TaxID=13706 RepID=A0A1X2HL77_SYNRA|nr:hypothetical protein BCR43DRAFT_489130 [Syncephalastrum racemosum]
MRMTVAVRVVARPLLRGQFALFRLGELLFIQRSVLLCVHVFMAFSRDKKACVSLPTLDLFGMFISPICIRGYFIPFCHVLRGPCIIEIGELSFRMLILG